MQGLNYYVINGVNYTFELTQEGVENLYGKSIDAIYIGEVITEKNVVPAMFAMNMAVVGLSKYSKKITL